MDDSSALLASGRGSDGTEAASARLNNGVAGTLSGLITSRRGMASAVGLVLVLAVVVGGAVPLLVHPDVLWITLCGAAVLALFVVRRRLCPVGISPPWMLVAILVGLAFAGMIVYPLVDNAARGATALTPSYSPELGRRTAEILGLSALSAAVGSAVASLFGRSRWSRDAMTVVQLGRWRGVALVGCMVPVIVAIASDLPELLRRDTYLLGAETATLGSIASRLGLVAVVILGFLLAAERGGRRLTAAVLLVLYTVLFFSFGSRTFAMIPLLVALGVSARALRVRYVVVGALLSVWLLQVPLALRGQNEHGLLPYLAHLDSISLPGGTESSLKNLLTPFVTIGATAFSEPRIPGHYLFVELNPLSGSASGWNDISSQLRLNIFEPYAAVGELANYGIGAMILFFACLGVYLTYLDKRISTLVRAGVAVYAFALIGVTPAFTVLLIEYNLRNAIRLLLYVAIAELVIRGALALDARLRSARKADDQQFAILGRGAGT